MLNVERDYICSSKLTYRQIRKVPQATLVIPHGELHLGGPVPVDIDDGRVERM